MQRWEIRSAAKLCGEGAGGVACESARPSHDGLRSPPVASDGPGGHEAEILGPQQFFHAAAHLGIVGDAESVATAGDLPPVGKADQEFEGDLAGISAENFIQHLQLLHAVRLFDHADADAAGIARFEFINADQFVDEEVGFLAAGPLVDAPLRTQIVSDWILSPNWANCSGQQMQCMMPAVSSRSNIA